jgi:hypothetical protein
VAKTHSKSSEADAHSILLYGISGRFSDSNQALYTILELPFNDLLTNISSSVKLAGHATRNHNQDTILPLKFNLQFFI